MFAGEPDGGPVVPLGTRLSTGFYRFGQVVVRSAFRLLGRLRVEGIEHLPAEGPFLLIGNHQSYLDPLLVQAVIVRPIYTMAKSTQFSEPITGYLLKKVKTFPVRRYEIDPQAVRLVLRYLGRGEGVGIYIEGERSWDARIQPPRLGVLRLILKAGVPVVPVGISGAYDVWPRWDKPRRGDVLIRFGPPMRFPQLDRKQDREAALPGVREAVVAELERLSGAVRAPGA